MDDLGRIEGLFVGQLRDDELRTFEGAIAKGLAYRSYEGGAGFMGLAKVRRRPAALAPSPVAVVAAIQSACQHERVREYPQVIDGNRFYMRQCEDCGMFNPPASAALATSPAGREG